MPVQALSRPRKEGVMPFQIIGLSVAIVLMSAVSVFANPSMLPKHEGYPMGKATDPVTGKSLSNDPGQQNATGAKAKGSASTARRCRTSTPSPLASRPRAAA